MSRASVINELARANHASSYLEIGVEDGNTFRRIEIASKTGVDPKLKTDVETLGGEFFAMTSDLFFAQNSLLFDIVFIDGMHTFEQSLADLLNVIPCLKPNGIIVLDDVFPTDYFSSLRDHAQCVRLKEQTGALDRDWMGDVYKTIAFVHDMLPAFSYGTCDDGSGHAVSILWRAKPRTPRRNFPTIGHISAMKYSDLLEMPTVLNQMDFGAILKLVAFASRR